MTDGKLADVLDAAYEALYDDKLDAARQALDQARRIAGGARDVRLLEIDILEADGAGEEAVSAAEEALEALPDDMAVTFRLATLLLDIYDDVDSGRPHLENLHARLKKGERPTATDSELTPDEKKAADDDFALEVLLTLSDCRAADLDPRGALAAADEACALAKDDAMARLARAAALFDLCELDESEKAIAQCIDRDPRLPDAYWLRGRLLTVRGDEAGANKAFAKAVALDEERFHAPHRVSEDAFAELMEASLADLPEVVRKYLKNVAISVQDVPELARMKSNDPPLSPGSLGLYEGTPPSMAPSDDPWSHFPSGITLFRKNIELAASNAEELQDLVGSTLLHEVGHYLGLDEEDLEARGLD
jgi:predicted Zn-dependent protease with MMP-like domain